MWCDPLDQTKPAEIPITTYSTPQTGANNQLGGLKLGLFKVTYQSFTEVCVAVLAKKPTNKHMAMLITIYRILFFKVFKSGHLK